MTARAAAGRRRRRRRGGRRRRKGSDGTGPDTDADADSGDDGEDSTDDPPGPADDSDGRLRAAGRGHLAPPSPPPPCRRGGRRRRRAQHRHQGPQGPRAAEDQITVLAGSTRLEAKKQRRREGREAGRRRAPIVSEAEFLARRESVERVMVIRQREELTQIAVLEDKVLVEHYVARESQTSLIGNVYLGRVQNVLPSMEAAFIDIGKGRNAVLYAGEVNWAALGHKEGQPRKIESVLSSGQLILVQVTKDPIGHKGARLTSQVSLAGRFLVYVPDGTTSGISRKLPDTERNRLKTLLKEIVPDTAGVIVRTAAEGASEDELTRDVERLKARWEDIEKKARGKGSRRRCSTASPTSPSRSCATCSPRTSPSSSSRATTRGRRCRATSSTSPPTSSTASRSSRPRGRRPRGRHLRTYRIDEQIAKGLDRKVWLPSGGSLVIDRTEAMTVVDVNTGKFTGSGGNLEETVTKNNLEAAEEIVRQLRLRDIGGIIVVDFIDMVLESNRDLVVRRLVECLGRDRTRHQVAEVTSLGLVQMTRKRIGTGLLEAFSHDCEHCHGRGVVIQSEPVEPGAAGDDERRSARSSAAVVAATVASGNGRRQRVRQRQGTTPRSPPPSPQGRRRDGASPRRPTRPSRTDATAEASRRPPPTPRPDTRPGAVADTQVDASAGTSATEGGSRRGSRRGGRSARAPAAGDDVEASGDVTPRPARPPTSAGPRRGRRRKPAQLVEPARRAGAPTAAARPRPATSSGRREPRRPSWRPHPGRAPRGPEKPRRRDAHLPSNEPGRPAGPRPAGGPARVGPGRAAPPPSSSAAEIRRGGRPRFDPDRTWSTSRSRPQGARKRRSRGG